METTRRRLLLGCGAALAASPALARSHARHHGSHSLAAPHVARHASPPLPLVLLDPGHGGKDPGAIGVSGTYEKHIAFATAMELRRQLQATGKVRVHLTRTRDIFIPLEDRVAIGHEARAALFVSVHADALTDHSVRGASVYTLSTRASDAQSAALAQRENSADRFARSHFHHQPPAVAHILASLERQETRAGSARMQREVVEQLGHDVPLLTNPARHAAFAVLKSGDIPSVLVEMGFMSNRQDEAALRQAHHRARVAQAMRRAVEGYFQSTGLLLTG